VCHFSLSLKLRLAWPVGGEERVDMGLGVGRLLALEVTSDFVMAVVVREFEEQNHIFSFLSSFSVIIFNFQFS
jgi:hypothetical protein